MGVINDKSFKHQKGFSLFDLLIAIAISAILSAIAIPSYKHMVAMAKRAEAKSDLEALHMAESLFMAEWGTYTERFDAMGLQYSGEMGYNVGFDADFRHSSPAPPVGAPQGTATCNVTCDGLGPGHFPVCSPDYLITWTCGSTAMSSGNGIVSTPTYWAFASAWFGVKNSGGGVVEDVLRITQDGTLSIWQDGMP